MSVYSVFAGYDPVDKPYCQIYGKNREKNKHCRIIAKCLVKIEMQNTVQASCKTASGAVNTEERICKA